MNMMTLLRNVNSENSASSTDSREVPVADAWFSCGDFGRVPRVSEDIYTVGKTSDDGNQRLPASNNLTALRINQNSCRCPGPDKKSDTFAPLSNDLAQVTHVTVRIMEYGHLLRLTKCPFASMNLEV